MPDEPSSPKRSRIFDIPDGLDDEENVGNGSTETPASKAPKSAPKTPADLPSKKGSPEGDENAAVDPQEYANEIPASEEEIKDRKSGRSEADMNDEFGRYFKAASESERMRNKKAFDLEMKLHSADLSQKIHTAIWAPAIVPEILDFLSEQMGVHRSDIVLSALVLFYRNCMSNERRMLHDMGFMLDNLALQNQELCMETSALEDLAQQAIELESSPYFSPDEDLDDDYAEEEEDT